MIVRLLRKMLATNKRTPETDSKLTGGILRDELRRHEVPSLTGLRFVAAFSVLIGHGFSWILQNHITPWGAIYWISQISGFGMTLFFVLSGFVIHYNYGKLVTEGRLRGVGTFLWARFSRLYPLLLLMMLAYVCLSSRTFELLTGHPDRFGSILKALPYFLLSIQSWVYVIIDDTPLMSAIGGGSPITWSISTEWFFYLAYPFVAALILRACTVRRGVTLAVLWCAFWIVISSGLYDRSQSIDAWAIQQFGPIAGIEHDWQGSFVRWLLYFSPYLRWGEFMLGTLVAQLYINAQSFAVSRRENLIGTTVFFVAAASVMAITYLNYSPEAGANIFQKMNMNFALAPSAALLIFCGARYESVVSRTLMSRPILLLGEASYSIYLVHDIVLGGFVKLAGSTARSLAFDLFKLVVLLTLVLLMSLALYTYYEAPARRFLRGLRNKRRSPAISLKTKQAANPEARAAGPAHGG